MAEHRPVLVGHADIEAGSVRGPLRTPQSLRGYPEDTGWSGVQLSAS